MLESVLYGLLGDAVQMIAHFEVDEGRHVELTMEPHRYAAQRTALSETLERSLQVALGGGKRREALHDPVGVLYATRRQQGELVEFAGNRVSLLLRAIRQSAHREREPGQFLPQTVMHLGG